ncbi:MAG: cysteine hydrolase family protein [Candidatus Binatia bacterium]
MTDHDKILEIIRQKDQVPITLEVSKTALLIIDMQRYFVRPQYSLMQTFEQLAPGVTGPYCERVHATVIPNINRLQNCFRAHQLPIIYTAIGTCRSDGQDLNQMWKDLDRLSEHVIGQRMFPRVNDPAWQIDDSLAPLPDELVVNKTSSGTLNSTMLDQTLRNMGIESLIVSGVTTDVCVETTARDAADRGFQVIVVEDACTAFSETLHRAALQAFSLAFGRVRRTPDIIQLLTSTSSL